MKIKFNMDFHGEYIRNLEDLRKNFSVEDILEAYDNGLLVKWLDARYYTKELKEVQAIEAKDARGVLNALMKIFNPETKQEEIDANLALYDYLEEHRKYREYVIANGLDELQTLREERKQKERLKTEIELLKKERDALKQTQKENDKLKKELEALRKENETLKQKLEQLKQSSTKSNSSSSLLIEAKVPECSPKWQVVCIKGKRCRIKGIGNCAYKLYVKSVDELRDVCTIEEAVKNRTIFNGISVRVNDGGTHSGLYFYYEEV